MRHGKGIPAVEEDGGAVRRWAEIDAERRCELAKVAKWKGVLVALVVAELLGSSADLAFE
jgi:hypothetical protein